MITMPQSVMKRMMTMNANGYTFCYGVCEKDALRYGEIILDEVYNTWD